MIDVVLRCDCPGCPTTRTEPVEIVAKGASVSAMAARRRERAVQERARESARMAAEEDGWFVERFPGKPSRDICPDHADAYRTMLHAAMGAP